MCNRASSGEPDRATPPTEQHPRRRHSTVSCRTAQTRGRRLFLASLALLTAAACPSSPTSHTVSGAVSGAIVDGVTITLSGPNGTKNTTTSNGGQYAFVNLQNGNYTLTPSKDGYKFTPPSMSVVLSDADANNRNFTSTLSVLYTISGTVYGDVTYGVTIALSGASNGTTTTSTGGSYTFTNLSNGVYTLTPSANGFRFLPESRTLTLSGANAVDNDFASGNPPTYGLTVAKSGSGTVTAKGLDCGSSCFVEVFSGTKVSLTATAASGFSFSSWSGCDVSSGPNCTITVTADRIVTANFVPNYTLTVAKSGSGSGTVSGTGLDCGSSCSVSVPSGTLVNLTAVAALYSNFSGWSGCDAFSGPSCTVTITSAKTVTADFAALHLTVLAGVVSGLGSNDGTAALARFDYPQGAAVDGGGNIYLADSDNNTIRKVTPAGVVTTLAGSAGVRGSSDGTGSAAHFNYPRGVAVDSSGNVYVADTNNNTIRKVTAAGVVTTLAGSAGLQGNSDGLGAEARFFQPNGVAVDLSGNVYVTDTVNSTIRKVTAAGAVITLAGSAQVTGSADGTGTAALFDFPEALTVDGSGDVYVADTGNSTIRKVTPAGIVTTIAGTAGVYGSADGTGLTARFGGPAGIAVDNAGSLYVADTGNSTIRKMTAGIVTTIAGTPGANGSADGTAAAARFFAPSGVAVDSSRNLYVADTGNFTIRKVTPAGVVTTLAGTASLQGSSDGTGAAARFNYPRGVAVDGSRNIYVADTGNSTIRKVTPAGVVTTLAGTPGVYGSANGTGPAAQFRGPAGVAVDNAGNVYVADTFNHTIRKVTAAAVVTTLAGTAQSPGTTDGTGSAARFDSPEGVAVDGAGNIYVADTNNHTIRKVTSGGIVTTIAGVPGVSGSPEELYYPRGVAVDSGGTVYVADSGNHTIRKVPPTGGIITLAGEAGVSGSRDDTGAAARFNAPRGVAVDSSGNVYVADTGNNTIRKVTPGGGVTTPVGVPGPVVGNLPGLLPAELVAPQGIAVDAAGNLSIALSDAVLEVKP